MELQLKYLLIVEPSETTSYHPQANGLVIIWTKLDPFKNTQSTKRGTYSAELVFGEPLTVPGDFIPASSTVLQPSAFLPALRSKVGSLAPIPTSQHGSHTASEPPA